MGEKREKREKKERKTKTLRDGIHPHVPKKMIMQEWGDWKKKGGGKEEKSKEKREKKGEKNKNLERWHFHDLHILM